MKNGLRAYSGAKTDGDGDGRQAPRNAMEEQMEPANGLHRVAEEDHLRSTQNAFSVRLVDKLERAAKEERTANVPQRR
jgi:hypothetical protein